jgi:hypothetical protein
MTMHKKVYTHPKIKSCELMLADAMYEAREFLELKECLDDMSKCACAPTRSRASRSRSPPPPQPPP